MNLDDFIDILTELRKSVGGKIIVKAWPYDGHMNPNEVEGVSDVYDKKAIGVDKDHNWIEEPTEPYIIIDAG